MEFMSEIPRRDLRCSSVSVGAVPKTFDFLVKRCCKGVVQFPGDWAGDQTMQVYGNFFGISPYNALFGFFSFPQCGLGWVGLSYSC